VQMAIMRTKLNYDWIDVYGDRAALFVKNSSLSKRLDRLIMYQFYQDKANNLYYLCNISAQTNSGVVNTAFISFIRFSYANIRIRQIVQKVFSIRWRNSKISEFNDVGTIYSPNAKS